MDGDAFSREELFELYKLFIDRENIIRKSWRSSFNFYSTLTITFLGSIAILISYFNQVFYTRFLLILGGLLIVFINLIAFFHFRLDYKYQMELLSVQVKIEDLLGMTDANLIKLPQRWGNEGLLPPWYYKGKNENSSSQDFIKRMCSLKEINGYSLIYICLIFIGFTIIICGILYKG